MAFADVAGSQAERVAAHKLALANVEKAIALDPGLGLSRAYLTRAFYRYPKGGVFRGRAREHDRNFVCCNARLLHFDRYPIASPTPLTPALVRPDRPVATGLVGCHFHRNHRYPGTHPV